MPGGGGGDETETEGENGIETPYAKIVAANLKFDAGTRDHRRGSTRRINFYIGEGGGISISQRRELIRCALILPRDLFSARAHTMLRANAANDRNGKTCYTIGQTFRGKAESCRALERSHSRR